MKKTSTTNLRLLRLQMDEIDKAAQRGKMDVRKNILGVSPFLPNSSDGKGWDGTAENPVASRLQMAKLPYRSLQLWIWMLLQREKNEDFVFVDKKQFMKECGIKTAKTYKAAVDELRIFGYIAPCVCQKSVFWLNPKHLPDNAKQKPPARP